MFAYLLLRDNKQSGPYSLDELKAIGIRPSDLLWIEGKSTSWCFPDEIEDLMTFVNASPISNRHASNNSTDTLNKENKNPSLRFENKTEKRASLPIQKKSKYSLDNRKGDEQVSKRSMDLRKNILNRNEEESFSSLRHSENKSRETGSYNFSLPEVIKIVIADDHRLFREGVKTALAQKSDVRLIGEAENGMQLINLLKHSRPDVILLDIQMPVMDGITALASIRKLYPDMKVIILSMHEGHSMVSALMEAGANGYLTKTTDPDTIYDGIKTCYEKNYYFSDLTNVSMLEGLRSKNKIPEKIKSTSFDGAELMQRLATAQKKTNSFSLTKTQKSMAVAACAILVLSAGVIAGKNIIENRIAKADASVEVGKSSDGPAKNVQPLIVPESTLADSSKQQQSLNQAIDSVQKNKIDELAPPEKNNGTTIAKNNVAEKQDSKKSKDSIKTPAILPTQKIDSSVTTQNSSSIKAATIAAPDPKAIARNSIHNLVTASVNNFHVGAFGGLSEIEITLNNRAAYPIDEAIVEVRYILSNEKIYKTETLNFQNIQAQSSLTIEAPKSARGQKVDYKIISIKSKELDLQ